MIVLDTHIVIWDALNPGKLSSNARDAIARAGKDEGIIICDISIWEIAMLINKKRLQLEVGCKEFLDLLFEANNYNIQEITPEIAELACSLPESINKDPADRLIAATSIIEGIPLVTADKNLRQANELTTIW